MAQGDAYDIVVTPTDGEPYTLRASSHSHEQGGPSVGDEVCVIVLVDGTERRVPLDGNWIEAGAP